jgi:hypothetical protein
MVTYKLTDSVHMMYCFLVFILGLEEKVHYFVHS